MLARIAALCPMPPLIARLLPATRRQWLLFTAVVFGLISYLSISTVFVMPTDLGLDKLGHALGYGLLMSGLMHAFDRRWWRLLVIGCLLLAVGFEGVQSMLPERTVSVWDILASMLGVVVAYGWPWRQA